MSNETLKNIGIALGIIITVLALLILLRLFATGLSTKPAGNPGGGGGAGQLQTPVIQVAMTKYYSGSSLSLNI